MQTFRVRTLLVRLHGGYRLFVKLARRQPVYPSYHNPTSSSPRAVLCWPIEGSFMIERSPTRPRRAHIGFYRVVQMRLPGAPKICSVPCIEVGVSPSLPVGEHHPPSPLM